MLNALAALGMLLFIGVTSLVGVRLLWRARQTRGTAELVCGLAFSTIALVGYPCMIAANQGGSVAELRMTPYLVGMLFNNLGLAFFYGFAWLVFRPGEGWAGTLAWAAWTALALGFAGVAGTVLRAPADTPALEAAGAWQSILQVLSIGCFAWMGIEGFRASSMARRRLALGLADPVVADRFRLFGLFGLSTMLLSMVFVVSRLLGEDPRTGLVVNLGCGVLGTFSSACVFLAFTPPKSYLGRVRARAAA